MAEEQTILVVDDEAAIREYVSENLEVRGYKTLQAASGLEAMALFQAEKVDLILLDIMMPHMDGFEACRRFRAISNVPIIMLTALAEEQDKVRALDLGADDYLNKPFGINELLARFRAIFRRAAPEPQTDEVKTVLSYQGLSLDTQNRAAAVDGVSIKLTKKEYSLLEFMMQNLGRTMTHEEILSGVWGDQASTQPEYLRVYMGRLRNRIEPDPSQPRYLISEYGSGYRLGSPEI